MPDTVRSLASLQTLLADNTAGDISAQDVRDFLVSAYQPAGVTPGGRLTTESGVGVSTSDRTSQSTLYYTPYMHNRIGLYDGTSWTLHTFTERSLSLSSLTSGKNYDVFLYDNSGTLTLELSAAWTNDTTRADALTTQDGVLVKSGSTTRRYLGTIRTTGTTTTEDSATKRFVWNAYNLVRRRLYRAESTSSWTYNSSTVRQANGSASNQVEVVVGVAGSLVELLLTVTAQTGASSSASAGIGKDRTNGSDNQLVTRPFNFTAGGTIVCATLSDAPAVGYYYAWVEARDTGSNSATYYSGDSVGASSGLTGSVTG